MPCFFGTSSFDPSSFFWEFPVCLFLVFVDRIKNKTRTTTAILLAHNLLAFFAAQFGWKMFFGDISGAFLQGENLDPKRVVLVAIPIRDIQTLCNSSWAHSVAGRDLVQFIKGGFGLAESPRLSFKKRQVHGCLGMGTDPRRLPILPRGEGDCYVGMPRGRYPHDRASRAGQADLGETEGQV